jgi:hypothetical protein
VAAVRADGDLLALETLFFADEVREPHQQISNLPGQVKLTRQELRMARQLIESMTGPWQHRTTVTRGDSVAGGGRGEASNSTSDTACAHHGHPHQHDHEERHHGERPRPVLTRPNP